MIRSCIRQAVRVFAGAALVACAITAQAANLTINASNCASYTVGAPDSSGNVTITCVPANGTGPLIGCSIQGPTTGTLNVPVTLTAVCSGGAPATNWTWSGGNCNVATQACSAVEQSAVNQTYSVTIHNGVGSDQSPTTQIAWSATAPAKPSGCSVTPTPSSLPAIGGPVSLTAQCTGGNPVSWVWSGATYTSSSGNTATATISSTTTFTATATNGGGSTAASTQVQVGGTAWPASCPNMSTSTFDAPWGQWITNQYGRLGLGQAVVIRFTTGSVTSSNVGTFTASNGSGVALHDGTLSTLPCDFSGTGQGSVIKYKASPAVSFNFTIGVRNGTTPMLQPNSTYYINIMLDPSASCSGTDCDYSVMNLLKP